MQNKRANELKADWGDKPCAHKRLDKEYYLGAQTGDYVCTQCGKSFSPAEARKLEDRGTAS